MVARREGSGSLGQGETGRAGEGVTSPSALPHQAPWTRRPATCCLGATPTSKPRPLPFKLLPLSFKPFSHLFSNRHNHRLVASSSLSVLKPLPLFSNGPLLLSKPHPLWVSPTPSCSGPAYFFQTRHTVPRASCIPLTSPLPSESPSHSSLKTKAIFRGRYTFLLN